MGRPDCGCYVKLHPKPHLLIGFLRSSQASLGSREVGTRASVILSAQHPFLLPLLLPQIGSVRPVMVPELTGSANRKEGWRMDLSQAPPTF